ncbi:virulence factor [Rhodopseudomonas palustris]
MTKLQQKPRRTKLAVVPGVGHHGFWPEQTRPPGGRMYAIAFDLDVEALNTHYHNQSWNNAYEDLRKVFEAHGFSRQQGSVYFGNEHVTPVNCVLAVQEAQKLHPWFGKAVRDIRMLRIEEHNDLLPAIAQQELELDRQKAAGA